MAMSKMNDQEIFQMVFTMETLCKVIIFEQKTKANTSEYLNPSKRGL